jgi:hypothetical protein
MARSASAVEVVQVSPLAAMELWVRTESWPHFVDGCAQISERDPAWPAPGSWVVWRSPSGGRGSVREEVVSSGDDSFTTSTVDASVVGTQTLTATPVEEGATRLELDLEYELADPSPFQSLMDSLFIRRALRDSLRRTLARFAEELERSAP